MSANAVAAADAWAFIPKDEYRERQRRVREEAASLGYDAVVVFSRGGAFVDMHADALYLTNHYSQQPYAGDEAGIGSGRSHAVAVLPVEGPTTVVVDVPYWRPDLVVADDARLSIEVPRTAAEAVSDAGLASGRIALVGASYMSAAAYLGFVEALPEATIEREDRLVERFRIRKSAAELELIRRSCALGTTTVDTLMDAVVEGATEAEAVGAASNVLLSGGGVLFDAACGSGAWSHQFTHARLPSADPVRKLAAGDLFHVDCYGAYGGYFFDFARSRCVGDEPTGEQRGILEAVIGGVDAMCEAIRPGVTAGDVFAVGDAFLASSEAIARLPKDEPALVSFPALGHGIGLGWEGPYLAPGDETVLEPGMVIAVEILTGHPSVGGAMFEDNGIVLDDGFEVITPARRRWWD